MTPGSKTLPGENKEILDRRPDEENDSGQKIRYTRKFCEKIRSEDEGCKKLIEEYHQSAK